MVIYCENTGKTSFDCAAGANALSPELVSKLNAMREAPMSKALDKEDLWRNRLREEIAAYVVPAKSIEDVNNEFAHENSEFRSNYGWCYNHDQSIQKKEREHFLHPSMH